MKYSAILSKVEKAISPEVDVVTITRIDVMNVTESGTDIIPGKNTPPGEYGIVDVRLMIPLHSNVTP